MRTVQKDATVPWPKQPLGKDWYRASVALDEAGTFALVRYYDVQRTLRGGLLWDLSKRVLVPGEHVDLQANGRHAVRRTGTVSEIVELTSGRVVAKLPDRLDVALSADATYAVQRPRADVTKGAVRPTLRVHSIERGRSSELPTRSILEAFVAGNRLATVATGGGVTLWDLATGKPAGKFPGIAKPASIRVDPTGTKVALGAFDGQYAIIDIDSAKPVAKGKTMIIFNGDTTFDGARYVGTNILLDVTTKSRPKSHKSGWLKGNRSGGLAETATIAFPDVAVVTQRHVLGNPVVEVWDVESESRLASTEVQPRADAIAFAGTTLVVAHLPADDEDWPALTLLTVGGARARPSAAPAVAKKALPTAKTAPKKKATTIGTTKKKTATKRMVPAPKKKAR